MKRNKMLLLLFIIALFVFAPTVYAGTANTDDMKIIANVNEDGSMQVNETIVWDIDGELNGVYRDILIGNSSNKGSSASDIKITNVTVDGNNYTYSAMSASNGDEGVYNVNGINNGVRVKVFVPSSDEKRIMEISYTLFDVVTKYSDVAEVYWNFIGKGWENGISNVSIQINLPRESNILKIYGHGPLNGNSKILDQKSVLLTADQLRSKQAVDARVVFDTDIVPYAKKEVNKVALEKIVADEIVLADEANAKRESAKKLLYTFPAVCGVAIVLPIFIFVAYKRKLPKAQFNGDYYRELPEDYGVPVMNKVLMPLTQPGSKDI